MVILAKIQTTPCRKNSNDKRQQLNKSQETMIRRGTDQGPPPQREKDQRYLKRIAEATVPRMPAELVADQIAAEDEEKWDPTAFC